VEETGITEWEEDTEVEGCGLPEADGDDGSEGDVVDEMEATGEREGETDSKRHTHWLSVEQGVSDESSEL
jgi:hypothetical protein